MWGSKELSLRVINILIYTDRLSRTKPKVQIFFSIYARSSVPGYVSYTTIVVHAMILRPYEPAGIIKTQSPVLATLIIELSSYVAIESHEACTGPLLLALSPGARFILLVKAEPITHNNATSDATRLWQRRRFKQTARSKKSMVSVYQMQGVVVWHLEQFREFKV